MINKPPKWHDFLGGDIFKKINDSKEAREILDKAQKEYVYWDKFKYYAFPKNIKPQEAWAYLKITTRTSSETTPIKSVEGGYFSYNLPKSLYQKLSFIDTHGGGLIKSLTGKPSEVQTSKYIISSLTEEAIASSQIEGANTTRKIAKEMILSNRKPRNNDEQMIVNNYRAMQKIEEWRDLELTEQMLLDLQKILTDQTMKDESDSGRLRTDEDDIAVYDPITNEPVHVPPKEKVMISELKNFIKYANKKEEDDEFVHPVIKATILHFWLAYLHPFVDGNGRCARIVFYWYLLKQDYWLIQYISVSRSIKQSRAVYDRVYLHSEYDDNDLTYFILYITDAFKKAILQFMEHFDKKIEEGIELKKTISRFENMNVRQVALLKYFSTHGDEYIDVMTHKNKNGISRATSNNDLRLLVKDGYLTETKKAKKLVYMPNLAKVKKVFVKK